MVLIEIEMTHTDLESILRPPYQVHCFLYYNFARSIGKRSGSKTSQTSTEVRSDIDFVTTALSSDSLFFTQDALKDFLRVLEISKK